MSVSGSRGGGSRLPRPNADFSDSKAGIRRAPLLSVQIADELRRDILVGHLTPADRISQESLSQRFQTSRMPIRDAILQLVREGYLVRGRGDGIAVAPLTIDEVKDMFRIEGMLVGYAARLACERATDEEIEDLWVLHERMKQEVSNKDFASAAQTNLKLHQGLNHLAKSRRLTSTIRHVSMRLHREFLIEFPEWITRSLADHERILSLLAQRNGAEVEVLMIDHICASGEEVVRSLAQNMEARRSKEAQ